MIIVKKIIFTYVIYAVTVCGIYQKQSLVTRTDHYSVYDNENEGGRWWRDVVNGLIRRKH